jgi:hypothetical protein
VKEMKNSLLTNLPKKILGAPEDQWEEKLLLAVPLVEEAHEALVIVEVQWVIRDPLAVELRLEEEELSLHAAVVMTIPTGIEEMKKEEIVDQDHLISRSTVAPVLLRTCEWIIEVRLRSLEVEEEANLVGRWMGMLIKLWWVEWSRCVSKTTLLRGTKMRLAPSVIRPSDRG